MIIEVFGNFFDPSGVVLEPYGGGTSIVFSRSYVRNPESVKYGCGPGVGYWNVSTHSLEIPDKTPKEVADEINRQLTEKEQPPC